MRFLRSVRSLFGVQNGQRHSAGLSAAVQATVPSRSRGDALRDAKDWLAAADAYRQHLAENPKDWDIWIQLGHCVKEGGDALAAVAIYRTAIDLEPMISDSHLQLGHALKLSGLREDAMLEYARAFQLDHNNIHAKLELTSGASGGPREEISVSHAGAALAFDISDLCEYLKDANILTGIQRVQLMIVYEILKDLERSAAACIFDDSVGLWRIVPTRLVSEIYDLTRLERSNDSLRRWSKLVRNLNDIKKVGFPISLSFSSVLVNLGASWAQPDYIRHIGILKSSTNARYAVFIHDCIPIIVPQYCGTRAVDEFSHWIAGVCSVADLVFFSSEKAADDFRVLQRAIVPNFEIPQRIVRLDAKFAVGAADTDKLLVNQPLQRNPNIPERFVLFVSTIEARKNHLLVFSAWLSMILAGHRIPRLICIGKIGWLAEPAMAFMRASPTLFDKIVVYSDISDIELAKFYDEADFVIYNSFYEGWGLPITEALSRGKIVVVPDHASMQDASMSAAVYFKHGDESSLSAAIIRLTSDQEFFLEHAKAVAALRFRSWRDVAFDIVEGCRTLGSDRPKHDGLHRIRDQGAASIGMLRFRRGPYPSRDAAVAELSRGKGNWSALEEWGCWALTGTSHLRIAYPDTTTEPENWELCLAMRASALPPVIRLTVSSGATILAERELRMNSNEKRLLVFGNLPRRSRPDIELTIYVDRSDDAKGGEVVDGKPFGVAIEGYCLKIPGNSAADLKFYRGLLAFDNVDE